MFSKFVCALGLLTLWHYSSHGTEFEVTKLHCQTLDEGFAHFEVCNIRAIGRNLTELSMHLKTSHFPIDLKLQTQIRKVARGNRTIYAFHTDACAFMAKKQRNLLSSFFYKWLNLKQYSNMNHTCPYNHDLIVHKLPLEHDHLKLLPLPASDYVIYSQAHIHNKERLKMELHFSVKK